MGLITHSPVGNIDPRRLDPLVSEAPPEVKQSSLDTKRAAQGPPAGRSPMLVVRQIQMDAVREGLLRRFEDTMLVHVREFFPERCAELGKESTREWIRCGIDRARGYGIEIEKDVCKYVDVSFVFGHDFDTKETWAPPILRSDAPGSDRLQALFNAALAEAERVP
jgi:hypothetical protein